MAAEKDCAAALKSNKKLGQQLRPSCISNVPPLHAFTMQCKDLEKDLIIETQT